MKLYSMVTLYHSARASPVMLKKDLDLCIMCILSQAKPNVVYSACNVIKLPLSLWSNYIIISRCLLNAQGMTA